MSRSMASTAATAAEMKITTTTGVARPPFTRAGSGARTADTQRDRGERRHQTLWIRSASNATEPDAKKHDRLEQRGDTQPPRG